MLLALADRYVENIFPLSAYTSVSHTSMFWRTYAGNTRVENTLFRLLGRSMVLTGYIFFFHFHAAF